MPGLGNKLSMASLTDSTQNITALPCTLVGNGIRKRSTSENLERGLREQRNVTFADMTELHNKFGSLPASFETNEKGTQFFNIIHT